MVPVCTLRGTWDFDVCGRFVSCVLCHSYHYYSIFTNSQILHIIKSYDFVFVKKRGLLYLPLLSWDIKIAIICVHNIRVIGHEGHTVQ